MGKPAVILLIVMVELGILFAGHAQMQTATGTKEGPASMDMLAPIPVSDSLHAGKPGESHLPKVRDITIDLFYDCTSQVYLTRSHRYIRQILKVSHEEPGVRVEESSGCEITQPGGRPVKAAAESPPASLASLSPGLILRL